MSDLHNGGTTAMTAYEAMLESLRLKRSPRITTKGGILVRDDGAFYAAEGWHPPHVLRTFAGIPVEIENQSGTVRSGVDRRGKAWSVRMMHDYGFVRGTKAIDGDAVDVFLGPDEQSQRVFIVHQNDPETGNFDEDKCLLGWKTPEDAKAAYLSNYDSPKFFRSMTEMTLDQFKNAMRSNARGGIKRKRKMGDPAIGPMFSADTGEWRKADQVQSLGVTQLMPEIPKPTIIETAIEGAAEVAAKTALETGNTLQMLPATNPTSIDPIATTAVPMESTAGTGTDEVLPPDPYAKLLADTIESKPEFSADAAAVRLVNTAMVNTEAPRDTCPVCGKDAVGKRCMACGGDGKPTRGEAEFSAEEGHWVTIGAKDGHGGTPVKIGSGGEIEKGPSSLKGKEVDKLSERTEHVSRHSIEALHEPYDKPKRDSIASAMKGSGWIGRPLLVESLGELNQAMTGSHRISAASHADLDEVPIVKIDEEKARQWKIDNGHNPDESLKKIFGKNADDDDRLRMLREIGDDDAVRLMEEENKG